MSTFPEPLAGLVGKCVLVQILGDAEAYLFDFDRLPPAQQRALVTHHLRGFDARMRAEGKADWSKRVAPFALLGQSMPKPILQRMDLSAPHEGLLLLHRESGGVLYCAARDEEKLAVAFPDVDALEPRETYLEEVWDPASVSFDYTVDRSESEGFTLGNIEMMMSMGGAELTLV